MILYYIWLFHLLVPFFKDIAMETSRLGDGPLYSPLTVGCSPLPSAPGETSVMSYGHGLNMIHSVIDVTVIFKKICSSIIFSLKSFKSQLLHSVVVKIKGKQAGARSM